MPSKTIDLEALRQVFSDDKQHVAIGKVTQLGIASDRTAFRVQVSLFPEEREVVATMTWDSLGDGTGWLHIPQVGDMVLVGFHDGDADEAFVIGRFANQTHKLPQKAIDGHLTGIARPGKKVELESDTKTHIKSPLIHLAKTDTAPTEALVLGNVQKEFWETYLDAYLNAPQVGFDIFGLPTFLDPALRTQLIQMKQTYVTDPSTNILSQLSFTERGD